MQYWEQLSAYYEANPYLTLGLAAVVLFLLLWLLAKMARREPKRVKAFSDNTGSVYVSVHAITDLIRATCEHIDDISKPRIRLRQKKGVTHLELRLRLESGSRIREIRNAIRDHLKRTLEANLGFDHLGNITVIIDEYKSGPSDAAAVSAYRAHADLSSDENSRGERTKPVEEAFETPPPSDADSAERKPEQAPPETDPDAPQREK